MIEISQANIDSLACMVILEGAIMIFALWMMSRSEQISIHYREKYMDLFFKCMELGREGHISEHGINYILGDEPLPNSSE
jgi:hypothetical protein